MNALYFASGDGPFFFNEQLRQIPWLPQIWDASRGFGENFLSRLWLDYPFRLIVKALSVAGFSWWMIEKLLWGAAFCIILYASYQLGRMFFGRVLSFICSLIYITNTYALLLFSGGQLGVALAYGFAPLVFLKYIQSIDKKQSIRAAIKNGLLLSSLVAFDLRLAYLVAGVLIVYFIYTVAQREIKRNTIRETVLEFLWVFGLPFLLTIFIHAFWILPVLLAGGGVSLGLSGEYTNPGMLKFLSVADFSHTLSLLHPNWPENLFGKIYFFQPEFLLVPVLSFASLLYIGKNPLPVKRKVIFLGLMSIAGSFLAKGVNEPFGAVFQWSFSHIPGFIMFRDPTKFYLFTALGYSVLIPFSLKQISEWASQAYKKSGTNGKRNWLIIVTGFFVIAWCFTIRPLFLGRLSGNLRPIPIPDEYVKLKNLLISDQHPSRVLWVPTVEKFAYSSDLHPVLSGDSLFDHASVSAMAAIIEGSQFASRIYSAGIRYVVVPEDLERRIFLSDYRYDSGSHDSLVLALVNSGLEPYTHIDNLSVFVNPSFNFIQEEPAIVKKQEYWSRIGLCISAIGLLSAFTAYVLVHKRRH